MEKNYPEQAVKLVNAWNAYALGHEDYQAAAIVNNDVRAYMKDVGETDYGAAMRKRREQIRTLELSFRSDLSRFSNEAMADPGVELDRIARKNLEISPHLGYSRAFRLALLENPRLATKYVGRPVRDDGVGKTQAYFAEQAQLKRYDQSPNVTISNIVTGLPRLNDNSIDISAAVAAVNAFGSDMLQRACQEELEKLVRTQIAIDGTPGSEANRPEMLREIRAKVRRRYPGLATAADGNAITERGLRELFPQHFK
jgi:hypothetical protein